jgi:hypothetical protein
METGWLSRCTQPLQQQRLRQIEFETTGQPMYFDFRKTSNFVHSPKAGAGIGINRSRYDGESAGRTAIPEKHERQSSAA